MITRIAIKNFRSLDVDFTLEPVTVIVGRSGTGKTNLIEAMRFLRKALTSKAHCVPPNENVYSVTRPETEPMSFHIEFGLGAHYEKYVYAFDVAKKQAAFPHHPNAINHEVLTLGDRTLFARQFDKWNGEPRLIQKPAIGVQQLMLPLISGVQDISLAYLLLTNGVGCYDFPGSVCASESKDDLSPEAGLADNAHNYAATLNRIRSNLTRLGDWKEIVGALQKLNDKIDNVDMNEQQGKRLIVGHKMGEKVFTLDIANESEGFRRFLAHLLAVYQTPAKQSLFFEEPEKGIHPGALETLAEELKAAPADGRGQVILTTHSSALLDQFDPAGIRVAEMGEHVTKIGRLVPEQLAALKEDLLRPGELFTVDPARMAEGLTASKVAEE
jgi:predicted ATPase